MKIFVRPVNIGAVEQEYYEIEVGRTQSLKEVYQVFQEFLRDNQNCSEDDYDFEIERIAIIQESRPNIKLATTAIIDNIVLQGNSDKFTLIFPRDDLPIVQIHDGEKYYYVGDYGKNELLYFIVEKKKEIKAIIQKGEYEYIKINGLMINYQGEKDKPFKGFLENTMNKMVKVAIKLNNKKDAGKKEEVVEKVQSIKVEVKKKEQIKEERKDEREKIEQKQEEKRQPKKQEKQEIKKVEKVQKALPIVPVQEPQAPVTLSKQQPNKDLLKLVIKFQSNTSNKKQEFLLSVDPSKSMLQLLPQIVEQLKSRGFHWQQSSFDKTRGDLDKLSIIYAGNQFKKLERQLRSFVNFPQESRMNFTFERHYDGGA